MSASDPTARPRNPLLAALGRTLEAVLERALRADPDTRTAIAALEGRAVVVDLAGPARLAAPALRVVVADGRLRVGPADAGESALRVAATPGTLLGLALGRDRDALPPGRVEIAGDAELARRLERIASAWSPDIDAAFARVFGDVAGVAVARAFRGAFAWSRDAARSLARDGADYLVEERGDVVSRAELDQFCEDVDELRERADRLAARIARLPTARGRGA
jgi:ubiquinone biosynthesis protein UbiJ